MTPSVEVLEGYLREATRQLYLTDPNTVTVNSARQHAEEQNDLEKGFFITQDWKARSKTLITDFVQTLLANDSPSSVKQLKVEQDTKHSVKRSSSDESASPSSTKRHKKVTSATKSKNSKSKKESSSSELSELSDLDEPKREDSTARDRESNSKLGDLDSSEDEPKQKTNARLQATSRTSQKEESESELSDLSSYDDKPKNTKKRGRKPKRSESSDDDKGSNVEAPSSRLKRKQPAVKTKRTTKRTKAESEDGVDMEDTIEKNEVDAAMLTDEDAVTKDEDLAGSSKPTDKKESKPLADDSDSSLSSVLDEPPPKKRKGKELKEVTKPKKSAAKEMTGDSAEIKKLQGQLVKCGVRKIWGVELKKYGGNDKAKIVHLRGMLRSVGMDGRFSEAKAREIKERRELMGELEAVNEMNDLWGLDGRTGRSSRSKAVRKSLKEESDDGEDDDDGQKPKVEDDEDVKLKATSRVSKRMADLAFLGSDSESE